MHKKIYIILMLSVTLILCGCGSTKGVYTVSGDIESLSEEDDTTQVTTEEALQGVDKTFAVYVCGAVANPGVYYMSADMIKQDALNLAGGFCEGAATSYVNLAEPVTEGEKVYFPLETELAAGVINQGDISAEDDGRVNLNTASKEELMTLPGIGESKANDIIAYREEKGRFENCQDLMNISGIKEGVYNKIKDYLVVD